jgi:subfamily B ATP-binding cassette protein HlyB/CyaB
MRPSQPPPADPGLEALVTLLHLKDVAADRGQIRHRLGTDRIGAPEMLRCAKDLGLKARRYQTDWSRLARTPLPAIASLRDGGFLVLAKAAQDKVLVQSPQTFRPVLMTRDEFLALWDGGLILMARRAGLADVGRRFDITWFLGAIHKYRRLLGEVLAASFFLQLFALVSPLFFQVVIDKVLVHRSLSTLDVLVIGLLAIALFETALGILRTYLFSHTTNRIDVELGARLFRHLLALPMAYFQARRVGDSVARVRELEAERSAARAANDTAALARTARDLRYFQARRESARVVTPPAHSPQVRFGVRAVLRLEGGEERAFQLVGEDEADPKAGLISYVSPLAKSLMGKEVGERLPFGQHTAEIIALES